VVEYTYAEFILDVGKEFVAVANILLHIDQNLVFKFIESLGSLIILRCISFYLSTNQSANIFNLITFRGSAEGSYFKPCSIF
jgi:hypothetical protein